MKLKHKEKIDHWPDRWKSLEKKLSSREKKDPHFWQSLVETYLSRSPVGNGNEAGYKNYFRHYWEEVRPVLKKHRNNVFLMAEKGYDVYLKKFLTQSKEHKELLKKKNDLGEEPLHVAVKNGHLVTVQVLIDQGADVNAAGFFNQSALHYAVNFKFMDIIQILLEANADLNIARTDSKRPLHVAIDVGCIEALQMFIRHDAEQLSNVAKEGHNPFYEAAEANQIEIMKDLLARGFDEINTVNPFTGYNVLHLAVLNDNKEMINILIQNGAKTDIKTSQNLTPLQLAASQVEPKVDAATALLAAGVNVNEGCPSPLYCLASNFEEESSDKAKDFAVLLFSYDAELEEGMPTIFDEYQGNRQGLGL